MTNNNLSKMKQMEQEMIKFEQDIFGLNGNSSNNTYDSYKKINRLENDFHQSALDMAVSKEIDFLLSKNQYASLLTTNKTELNNKAHLAIAAAGCASSSSNILPTKKKYFFRKAAGKVWNDPTMDQWSSDDFRLFVGNLGREVNERMLSEPFMQYSSFIKAHVVKNRETSMSRGCYGFVSFRDSKDYLQAMKEMNGRYVGSRPMKIVRSNWKKRNVNTKQ